MSPRGRPPATVLTAAELDVMHTFWECGELTINESRSILAKGGHMLAVTTIATLIRHLESKGYLQRNNDRQPRRFRASISLHEVSGRLLEELIDRVYAGSRTPLLVRLVQEVPLTDELRERLEQFLEDQDVSTGACLTPQPPTSAPNVPA